MPIYTIGHSNHTQEAFLSLLRLHQIEVLIDTRSAPYSRFAPQFNKNALRAAVLEQGIKYGFYGRELGGRPGGDEFYDARGRVLYEEVANSPLFREGLARLVQGAETRRVALLCSEEDPNVCHRRLLIARALDGQGTEVAHIRGDGRLETERELQAEEERRARERERRAEEKRLAGERRRQDEEARRAARRAAREGAARLKLQRKIEAEAARREKESARQGKAAQQAADREQRKKERARQAAESETQRGRQQAQRDSAEKKPLGPKKAATLGPAETPGLFDTEEA